MTVIAASETKFEFVDHKISVCRWNPFLKDKQFILGSWCEPLNTLSLWSFEQSAELSDDGYFPIQVDCLSSLALEGNITDLQVLNFFNIASLLAKNILSFPVTREF